MLRVDTGWLKDSSMRKIALLITCILMLICGTMAEGNSKLTVKERIKKNSARLNEIKTGDYNSNETFTADYFDNLDLDNISRIDLLYNESYPDLTKRGKNVATHSIVRASGNDTEENDNSNVGNDKDATQNKDKQHSNEKDEKGNLDNGTNVTDDLSDKTSQDKNTDINKMQNGNSEKDSSITGISENINKDNKGDHTEYRSEYRTALII